MKVKATEGLKVPREDNPRTYITETEPVEVEASAYYIRRLADQELVEVKEEVAEQPNPTDLAAITTKIAKLVK